MPTYTKTYKDLDLDFGRNPITNDVNKIEDVDAVKRSVKNLVQTNFYERPFHPELGCGVRELLFENYTPLTGIFLKPIIGGIGDTFNKKQLLLLANLIFALTPLFLEIFQILQFRCAHIYHFHKLALYLFPERP